MITINFSQDKNLSFKLEENNYQTFTGVDIMILCKYDDFVSR